MRGQKKSPDTKCLLLSSEEHFYYKMVSNIKQNKMWYLTFGENGAIIIKVKVLWVETPQWEVL